MFTAVPFNVVSIKSNDKNDVKTDNGKQKFSKGEAINLIIKCYNSQAESEQAIMNGKSGGISPGQIKNGAWAGLFKLGDANSAQAIMSINLDDNSTIRRKTSDGSLIWNLQAPLTAGEYIVKVFTQETDKDKRDPVFFAELPITVTNTTKITESQGAFDWANYTIQVTPKPITVKVGSSITLNVVAKPKTGAASSTPTTVNNLVTFTITDKDAKGKEKLIASVKLDSLGKGVIKGLKPGTTKLYITPKGNSKYGIMLMVTVKAK
jgi:hypothetical protein